MFNPMKKILSLLFAGCCSLIAHHSVVAQPISTDGTLPNPTEVTSTDSGVEINGGTTRGDNLFHSFQDFSVPAELEAHFNNNTDVVNILNRVTGGNISNIDGLIRANGGANLFLINPAGIIFGSDAKLDIGGSFFGTTADGLLFDDGTEFSATNTQPEPILTINAPIGLNFRDNPQPIINQAAANGMGLQVDRGNKISLVGGDINFAGGILTAPGGRVELGGLSAAGEIGISADGKLSFPDRIARADVALTDGAAVNVAADGGGSINVNASNFKLTGESGLLAGITEDTITSEAQAGDITIDVTNAIALRESSTIQNSVNPDIIGDAGEIKLQSGSLVIDSGAKIWSVNLGQGNGGDIVIAVRDNFNITGEGRADPNDNSPIPSIASAVFSSTRGNSGNIAIDAGSFSLTNFTAIDASNYSSAGGNAGNIAIAAGETILISESGINSLAGLMEGASGNAGNIKFTANLIRTEQFSFIDSSNFDTGNSGNIFLNGDSIFLGTSFVRSQIVNGQAGDINIYATDVLEIDGTGAAASGVTIQSFGTGNSGNLNLQANSFSLERGAILNAVANSEGNGGNIKIDANKINLDRALINASSFDRGKGGNIQIFANDSVEITGTGLAALQENILAPATQNPAVFENFNADSVPTAGFQGILAATFSSEGTVAGNIDIDTANLTIKEGGAIATATIGSGAAGNITIDASKSLEVNKSVVTSSTIDTGQAGNIEIDTSRFLIAGGGQIAASSLASGDGGNLTINADEFLELRGTAENGAIASSLLVGSQLTSGTGNSGNLKITTSKLNIRDGAEITASSLGDGNSGSIEINAADSVNLNNGANIAVNSQGQGNAGEIDIFTNSLNLEAQSRLSAETEASQGGNIQLEVLDLILLRDNSSISTTAGSEGIEANGGNIEINTNSLVAFPNQNNDITANAFQGRGGKIQISTQGIFGITPRKLNPVSNDINASSDFGLDGDVAIKTPDFEIFQETTPVPDSIVESEQQVVAGICNPVQTAQNILAGTEKTNTFTIKGRGAIPPQPIEPLTADNVLTNDRSTPANWNEQPQAQSKEQQELYSPILTSQGEIYPARGIIANSDGTFILTAHPTNRNRRKPHSSLNCER